MALLDPEQQAVAVAELDGWRVEGGALVREVRLGGFRETVALVVRIAFEAEAVDHHPDIDIRYNRVRLRLSTHSEGGLTGRDVDLARTIDGLLGPPPG